MQYEIVPSAIKYHNDIQRAYFADKIKSTMLPADSPYVRRHIDEFILASGIQKEDQILEVGCGMGKFSFELLKRGYRLTGLDLSPFLLGKLLEYNNNTFPIDLICSDILEIAPEYNERFDTVIGFFTLHHFQQLHSYFQAMARVLKPGGRIIFTEPNAYNPLYYFQIFFKPGMSWKGDKGVAEMHWQNFRKAAEYAGLELKPLYKFGFFPPFVVNKVWGRRFESFLEKLGVFRFFSAFQVIELVKPH